MPLSHKPKAILFDWDNTLADTWPIIHKSLQQCFVDMGRKVWDLEETKQNVHRSMREYFPSLFGDKWEEAGKIYRSYYQQNRLEVPVMLPYAKELIEYLNQIPEIHLAVISNKPGFYLREDIEKIGWTNYFDKIIGAEDALEDKPSLLPVMLALEGSKVHVSDNIWFVGDSLTDMECAYNLNAKAILYGESYQNEEIFKKYPPHAQIHTLRDLIKILDNCT